MDAATVHVVAEEFGVPLKTAEKRLALTDRYDQLPAKRCRFASANCASIAYSRSAPQTCPNPVRCRLDAVAGQRR